MTIPFERLQIMAVCQTKETDEKMQGASDMKNVMRVVCGIYIITTS